MVRIKFGSLVSSLSGGLGGVVYASGAAGAVVVRRRVAGRSGVERRLRVSQSRFVSLVRLWGGLSDTQRLGWQLVGERPSLGMASFVSGNLVRLNAGLGIQLSAPADLSRMGLLSLVVKASAPDVALLYFTPDVLPSGFRLYVYAARPTVRSIQVRPSDMAFLGVSGTAVSSPFDLGPFLVGRYGGLVEGCYLHLFVKVLKDDGGVLGPGLVVSGSRAQVGPFVPSVEGDFMLPVITPLSVVSLGVNLSGQGVAAPASAAWGTANLAQLYPFVVTRDFSVQTFFWFNGGTISGNVDVGVYTSLFSLVVSTGPVGAVGANTLQIVTVPVTVLSPGRYFLAISLSSATGTIFQTSLGTASRTRYAGVLEQAAAFPLPSVIVPTAATKVGVQLCGVSELSSVY